MYKATMKTALALLFSVLLQIGASAQQGSRPEAQLFDYDASAALDILGNSKELVDGITVHDLSYAGPKGGRVTSYMVVPPGGGPFAAFDDPVLGPFMKGLTAEQKQKYGDAIHPIEPIRFVGNSGPASLFFQFARHDRFISEQAAKQFYEAAGQPKQSRWYFCSHEFNDSESRLDRIDWISQQLGVRVQKSPSPPKK